jgi:hypothetical protein
MNVNAVRTGFAVGAVLGLWHLIWSVLVAVGAAQAVIGFVLWVHFIDVPVRIAPFSIGIAAMLVAVTSLVGFAIGYVFAVVWNRLHQPGARYIERGARM